MFEAEDKGSDADCRELKYTCPARETLVLKEGATVILLRNLSAGEMPALICCERRVTDDCS
jgi:hypothetical protein